MLNGVLIAIGSIEAGTGDDAVYQIKLYEK